MLEKADNPTINGGTFIAVSNEGVNMKPGASNDIVETLHARSAPAGLLDAAERFNAPKLERDEGTRGSMLRGMKNFVQQDGPAALLWLRGPAGSGKSALAQLLALSLKDRGDHAASYFFSGTSPGRNDGSQLIITLACQLALSIPAIKPMLAKAVKENPLIFDATNAIKMQRLIVDPINQLQLKMSRWNPRLWALRVRKLKSHPRLILVDGLDECNDPQVQEDLLHCIALAVQQLSLPFRFIIISRPQSHILATFGLDPIFQEPDGVKVSINNLGDEDAEEQITKFLLKEFAEIRRTHPIRELLPKPWPIPRQIAQLVSRSSLEFIYPATVIRYITMPDNRPDECLKRILGLPESPMRNKPHNESLNVLYRYIFELVPDINKEAIRSIFHFLLMPNNFGGLIDRTPRMIEHYFNYKPGHVQLVLRDLLCVVTVTSIDNPIKVLHASLSAFLFDRSKSGPLCIDKGPWDVHTIIAASFPLVLRTVNPSYLPDFRFAVYLEHMMESNMSDTIAYHRLVNVDFGSRYIDTCAAQLSYIHHRQGKSFRLFDADIEGIAFVAAYLLVLLKKNAQKADIRRHITEIEAHILRKHPFAASLHAVRDELFPTMIPLFRKWISSTIDHDYINYVFKLTVPHSKREISEEVFELYFLMTATFFGHTVVDENHSQNVYPQPRTQQLVNYSNHISLKLLEFLLRDYRGSSVMNSKLLAIDLVKVSLTHADYSTSLTTLLLDLLDCIPAFERDTRRYLRRLAPGVTDHLERVYSTAPIESQQEILELNDEWKQHLNQQNT